MSCSRYAHHVAGPLLDLLQGGPEDAPAAVADGTEPSSRNSSGSFSSSQSSCDSRCHKLSAGHAERVVSMQRLLSLCSAACPLSAHTSKQHATHMASTTSMTEM
jgi:hypothetical protein